MQAPAAPAGGPPLQSHALTPAQPERDFGDPILDPCVLQTMNLADGPGNAPKERNILVASESGFTCLLARPVKNAIYGQVWAGFEVGIHGDYFSKLVDGRGLERRVAIKVMSWTTIERYREEGKVMENPLREIAALALLSEPGHPNVLRKLEALTDGTWVFLVTPFIDDGVQDTVAGEMFDWVAGRGGRPEDSIRGLFRQIVEGMRYMHSMGVCHADMSLENALIDRDGHPYIIDFGMSLLMPIAKDGRRYMSVGDRRRAKASYCTPEGFDHRDYDGVKVDVFAAGAMLFMMLCGFPPFSAATRADSGFRRIVCQRDVNGLLRSYGKAELSDDAVDLLTSMMALDPELRPIPEEALAHPWFNPPPPPQVVPVADLVDAEPAGVAAVA